MRRLRAVISKSLIGCFLFVLVSAFNADNKITIYLIGDSTMSEKETIAYPETGWGMPFRYFFDSTVVVENHAKNGRSTRSFLAENRWEPVVSKLKPGDYVFIQFGHNDESKEKTERYTTPEQYKQNLLRFVQDTKKRKATPILITPVSRRKFIDGKVQETHAEYTPLVIEVATASTTPLIDLDRKSRELYGTLGEENSKLLFLQLQPGEHPNYPDGKIDNTHFNELGARKIAQLVWTEMVAQRLDLCNHAAKPKKK